MGRISTSAVAAHQIALQVAAILYMVPFGIAHGRDRARRARRWAGATRSARDEPDSSAIGLGVGFMGAMTLIVALTRHAIPLALPRQLRRRSRRETVALAATLLVLGASFFITDGAQTVAGGALRGPQRHARAAALLGR